MKIDLGTSHFFDSVNNWANQSVGNYNQLIGGGFVLVMVSIIILLVLIRAMGPKDERTNQLNGRLAGLMLITMVLLEIIFPKGSMWHIYFLFRYGLTFLVGSVYIAWHYFMDFHRS